MGHHAAHYCTWASPAADMPRDVGGLGSSELIARLGGWHLEGPGRAYLMPGINRATAARGFPGLRSFGDTALPQGAGAGLHLAIPPTALASYVCTDNLRPS